jgi:outer membrane protein assembly factor BamD (BamD/ComL family)
VPSASSSAEPKRSLAFEVDLLDRARRTLLAGRAADALSTLDRYGREYPSGILQPEAAVLRIQALEQRGDRAAAAALARQFIASHPGSRHVESLRALVESTER